MHEQILKSCPLFYNIKEMDIHSLLNCLSAKIKNFKKSNIIFMEGDKITSVGIVLSGEIHIVQEDFWGNRTIISSIKPGDLFGEAFSFSETETFANSVIAMKNTSIMFIDYKRIIETCPSSCEFHNTMIKNVVKLLAGKNISLIKKISHITKRTTQERLLSYLSEQAIKTGSSTVTISFNRQELADYLCVDRSALSRELSSMKKKGLIDVEKNQFILYDK